MDALGPDGAAKVSVKRIEPTEVVDPATGTRVNTGGHLKDYFSVIEEADIAKRHGGGKYEIRIFRKNAGGTYVFFKQRTIEIAGEPRIDDLPRNAKPLGQAAVAQQQANVENTALVGQAFAVLKGELDRKNERPDAGPRGVDPSMQIVIDMMNRQAQANAEAMKARDQQMLDLQRELRESKKPVEDPTKDKWLDKLMTDDSARLQAVRLQYQSEIDALKRNHDEDLKRMEDRHDRAMDNQRRSYDREIDALKQTNLIQIDAAKGAFETNMKLADSDNRRLERDNAELRIEMKELRAKKEKSFVEMCKEIETVKETIGVGDEGDKSTADKVIEALPAAFEFAKGMIPQKAPAVQVATGNPGTIGDGKPKLVATKDGQRFWQQADGQLIPVKKKKKQAPPVADGMPTIDQEVVTRMVDYLERAFQANQDPEIFAQSSRTMVPDEVLAAIRDHGVEVFMSKVAKLPGTSPLSTQAGKNWLRKVGKALVGE